MLSKIRNIAGSLVYTLLYPILLLVGIFIWRSDTAFAMSVIRHMLTGVYRR